MNFIRYCFYVIFIFITTSIYGVCKVLQAVSDKDGLGLKSMGRANYYVSDAAKDKNRSKLIT